MSSQSAQRCNLLGCILVHSTRLLSSFVHVTLVHIVWGFLKFNVTFRPEEKGWLWFRTDGRRRVMRAEVKGDPDDYFSNLEVPRISPWRKPPTALYDHVRDYYCMERNGRKLYRETGPIAARSSKTRGYLVLASTCNKSQTLSAPLSISLFLKKFFLRHAPNPPRWYESNVPGDDGLLRVFLYKEQTAKRTERVFLSRFCFALKEFLFFLSRVSRRGAKITTFSCRNETKSERTPKISIGFSFCRSQVIGGMTINFRQV
jgi:hypothetical protein